MALQKACAPRMISGLFHTERTLNRDQKTLNDCTAIYTSRLPPLAKVLPAFRIPADAWRGRWPSLAMNKLREHIEYLAFGK
jgi:hypothetical protein